jgi:hypothetical protein
MGCPHRGSAYPGLCPYILLLLDAIRAIVHMDFNLSPKTPRW